MGASVMGMLGVDEVWSWRRWWWKLSFPVGLDRMYGAGREGWGVVLVLVRLGSRYLDLLIEDRLGLKVMVDREESTSGYPHPLAPAPATPTEQKESLIVAAAVEPSETDPQPQQQDSSTPSPD